MKSHFLLYIASYGLTILGVLTLNNIALVVAIITGILSGASSIINIIKNRNK